MPAAQATNLFSSILTLVFYLIMVGFVLYSLIALYALLRFGRSKTVAMTISIIYLIMAGGLYAAAVTNLHAIKF